MIRPFSDYYFYLSVDHYYYFTVINIYPINYLVDFDLY